MEGPLQCWRRRIQQVCAIGVASYSVILLAVGWLAGVEILVRLRPGHAATVPTTAICFCLLAVSIALSHAPSAGRILNVRLLLCAALVLVALNMLARQFNGQGVDAIIVPGLPKIDGMAPGTALGLAAAAYCVECLPHNRPARADMSSVVAVMGLTLAFAILASQSYVGNERHVPWFAQTSAVTAGLFVVLFSALAIPNLQPFTAAEPLQRPRRH